LRGKGVGVVHELESSIFTPSVTEASGFEDAVAECTGSSMVDAVVEG